MNSARGQPVSSYLPLHGILQAFKCTPNPKPKTRTLAGLRKGLVEQWQAAVSMEKSRGSSIYNCTNEPPSPEPEQSSQLWFQFSKAYLLDRNLPSIEIQPYYEEPLVLGICRILTSKNPKPCDPKLALSLSHINIYVYIINPKP